MRNKCHTKNYYCTIYNVIKYLYLVNAILYLFGSNFCMLPKTSINYMETFLFLQKCLISSPVFPGILPAIKSHLIVLIVTLKNKKLTNFACMSTELFDWYPKFSEFLSKNNFPWTMITFVLFDFMINILLHKMLIL